MYGLHMNKQIGWAAGRMNGDKTLELPVVVVRRWLRSAREPPRQRQQKDCRA
jgi:hypothetical protein